MPAIPFSTQVVTAPTLNDRLDDTQQVSFLFSDVLINNTNIFVLTNVPDLTLPLEADAWYIFDSLIMYQATTTADVTVKLLAPSNTFFGLAAWVPPTSATTVVNNIDLIMATSSTTWSVAAGGVGTGTTITARPRGYIVTDVVSGDLNFQIVQTNPEASNAFLKQGSWLSLSRVF